MDVSVAEIAPQGRSRPLSPPAWRKDVHPRIEVRCEGCGYGAVVRHLPARCPMCGGAAWIAARTVNLRGQLWRESRPAARHGGSLPGRDRSVQAGGRV